MGLNFKLKLVSFSGILPYRNYYLKMCGGKPCFDSVFGISLKTSVLIVGIIELVITIIATILNIIKYATAVGAFDDDFGRECDDKDVCIGPIIKYAVFDGFFGVGCALLLIFGAQLRNHCLLILWMIITVRISTKYLWVVFAHDWTSLEDWISITYLLFYLAVFAIIFAFMKEVRSSPSGGYFHDLPSVLPGCICYHICLHERGTLFSFWRLCPWSCHSWRHNSSYQSASSHAAGSTRLCPPSTGLSPISTKLFPTTTPGVSSTTICICPATTHSSWILTIYLSNSN